MFVLLNEQFDKLFNPDFPYQTTLKWAHKAKTGFKALNVASLGDLAGGVVLGLVEALTARVRGFSIAKVVDIGNPG